MKDFPSKRGAEEKPKERTPATAKAVVQSCEPDRPRGLSL